MLLKFDFMYKNCLIFCFLRVYIYVVVLSSNVDGLSFSNLFNKTLLVFSWMTQMYVTSINIYLDIWGVKGEHINTWPNMQVN